MTALISLAWRLCLLVSLGIGTARFAIAADPPGNVTFQLSIRNLPTDLNEQDVRDNVVAAAELWTSRVVTKPVSVEIELTFKPWPGRGAGRSVVGVPIGEKVNGKNVLEEGLPHELRTGRDPNGAAPDVEITLDPEYTKTLWWDPRPANRKRGMPTDKLDAVSVLAHEFGHAMGFNGRIDPKTGNIAGGEMSVYDRWVEFDGTNFFFNGPAATKLYRKKIPLSKTQNNYHHFGEPGPRLDRKLENALMNGIFMKNGFRFEVSDLDLAILTDCGLEVKR